MSATELDPNEPNLEDEQKPVLFDIQLKNRLETDFQRYYEVSKEDPGDDDFPETAPTLLDKNICEAQQSPLTPKQDRHSEQVDNTL